MSNEQHPGGRGLAQQRAAGCRCGDPECWPFERGGQHKRIRRDLEVSDTDRLSRSAPLATRIGDRHVTTWSGFDNRSDTPEYRARRRAWKASASATGGQPREKGAYDVQQGNGTRRGTGRAASVVVAGEAC